MYYGMDDPQAAANGLGRYFGYDDPHAAANGVGEYFGAQNGLGAYFTQQAPVLPMQGVDYGDDGAAAAATLGTLWLVVRAAGGYAAARAMAPTPGDRNTWAAVGALLGTLGGPAALGLMGVLALKARSA